MKTVSYQQSGGDFSHNHRTADFIVVNDYAALRAIIEVINQRFSFPHMVVKKPAKRMGYNSALPYQKEM